MQALSIESRIDQQSFITPDRKLAISDGMFNHINNTGSIFKRNYGQDRVHIIESPPLLQVVNSRHEMTVMGRRLEWLHHLIALTTERELMLFNQLYPTGIKIELSNNTIKNGEIVYIMLWKVSAYIDYLVVIDVNHTLRFISIEDLLSKMLTFSSFHYNDRIGFEQLIPIANIVSVTLSDIHFGHLYWLDQSGVIGWITHKKDGDEDDDYDGDTTVTIHTGTTEAYQDLNPTSLRYGYLICDNRRLYHLQSLRVEPELTIDDERKIIDVYSWPIHTVLFDDGSVIVYDADQSVNECKRIVNDMIPQDVRVVRFIIDWDHHLTNMELEDGRIVCVSYHHSRILPHRMLWYQPS